MKTFFLFLVFLASLALTTDPAWGVEWSDLSNWDPIGENIFRPLEKAVPGLKLYGFIENEFDISLHKHPHKGLNLPKSESTFQKIQWLFELEGNYNFNDKISLNVILDMLYDSVYDWDDDFKKSYNRSERKLKYFRQGKRILREMYFQFKYPDWNLRVGKQQVVWGKVDGAKIMDIINPEDFREMFDAAGGGDWEYSRLPLWMVNFTRFFNSSSVQFLWIPEFEASIVSPPGSVWEMNKPFLPSEVELFPGYSVPFRVGKARTDEPPKNFKSHEFASRYRFLKGGWDIRLSYFYTWSDIPVYFTRVIPGKFDPSGLPGELILDLQPKHTRIHQFGTNFEKGVYFPSWDKDLVFRGEILYTMNDYFGDYSDLKDGQTKRDWVKTGLVMEGILFTDWSTALRLDNNFIIHHDSKLQARVPPVGKKLDHWQTGLTLSAFKTFYEYRGTFEFWTSYSVHDGDWWWHATCTFSLTDYIILMTGINIYSGNPDDLFGQYDEMDNIEFGIRYRF